MTIAIVIPVYNNSDTIEKTLDSILAQTIKNNIELVISDDASKDNTNDIVDLWISKNKQFFFSVHFIKNDVNQGVSCNHRIAFEKVKSTYALYIGGDDYFTENLCLERLIEFLKQKNDFVIGKMDITKFVEFNNFSESLYSYIKHFFELNSVQQFKALNLFSNFLYAGPGTVIHIPTLQSLNYSGFDDRIKTFEDLPLFFNFLLKGFSLRFIPVSGLSWVRYETSLSNYGFSLNRKQFNDDLKTLYSHYLIPNLHLFNFYERFLLRIKSKNRLIKYLFYLFHPFWINFRFVPGVKRRIRNLIFKFSS